MADMLRKKVVEGGHDKTGAGEHEHTGHLLGGVCLHFADQIRPFVGLELIERIGGFLP